jgi:hypothetical protein
MRGLKSYTFTSEEVYVLRDAMVEYYQSIKNSKPNSPIAVRAKELAMALKDQLKQDATLI